MTSTVIAKPGFLLFLCTTFIIQTHGISRIVCNLGLNNRCESGNIYEEFNSSISSFNWTLNRGSTPTLNTGPDIDQTTNSDQGYYYFLEASDPRLPNDKARLYTSLLEPGRYAIQFWYHAYGNGIGGLNVYTRGDNSQFSKLVWYYSQKFNGSFTTWTQVRVEVNQISSFQVLFDGWRGVDVFGDLAIDGIFIDRLSNAVSEVTPASYGLPITCNFEVNTCELQLVTVYPRSQFDWSRQSRDRTTMDTGPAVDHTYGTDFGYWLLMDATNAPLPKNNMRAVVGTRRFWSAGCGCFYLDFWYHAYGQDVNRLEVWLEGNDLPLLSLDLMSEDVWKHIRRTYWADEPTELLFVGYAGAAAQADIALDDISIEYCDECTTQPITTTTTTTTSRPVTTQPTTQPTTTIPTTTPTTATTTTTTTSTTTTTTPSPTSTTPHPVGQHDCDFDSNFCDFVQSSVVDSLMWMRVGGVSNTRVPRSGIGGSGMFAFVNSGDLASNNVAELTTGFFVYNPNTCHMVRFRHSISAGTVSTLRVWLLSESSTHIRELWSSSTPTLGWTTPAAVGFRYHERFRLRFEAKRTTTTGGGDFALDNVVVPAIDCTSVPLYPDSMFSSAAENSAGTETEIIGISGAIESPNYPQLYPDSFSHTWTVSVQSGSTIQFSVTNMDTEADTDILTATDGTTGTIVFSLSGSPSTPQGVFTSESNQVRFVFSSDSDISLSGWRVEWWQLDPTTTVSVTTPAAYGYLTCNFDSADDCADAVVILNDTDYSWSWLSGQSPNYPSSGPMEDFTPGISVSGYLFMDSSASVNDETGSFTVGPVFHNSGRHKLRFAFHSNGNNLGSLSASAIPVQTRKRRQTADTLGTVIWSSPNVADDIWQTVSIDFEEDDAFIVKITGKRTRDSQGSFRGGDIAVDDLSVTDGDQLTTAAPALVNGATTDLSGTGGYIRSPYYPQPYVKEGLFSHVWDITTSPGTAIAIYFEDFETEACCDTLRIFDPSADVEILAVSGDKPSTPLYTSSNNSMRVSFSADDKVFMRGFKLEWYVTEPPADPTVTVATTSDSTTVVVNTVASTGAQISETGAWNWWLILLVVLLILAVLVIIVLAIILYIKKRNAQLNKISSSQEHLSHEEPRLVEDGQDFNPQGIYGNYDRPAQPPYYDNGSMGGQTATTNLNESGRYSLVQYDPHNVVTNPLKKRHGPAELDYSGQPIKKKKGKKAKKLDHLRDSRRPSYSLKPQTGIISVPDGQGNASPESYVNGPQRDNPPEHDM